MTELEQNLLAIIQDAFPLEERPYQVLAEQLGSDEQSVFAAVENLRRSGIIRRIGGVYDSKALGFISRLCAGKVPTATTGAADDSALEKFAAVVNVIPAITHNYVRSHEYNVWFTVMAQSEAEIQKIVDEVCANTELHDVHILNATEKFKINTVMKGAGAPVDSRQWSVDRNSVNPAGAILASKPYISHCYNRPPFEGFPYTLYAMMHAQSAEELDRQIKEAAESIGNPDYVVLRSVRELKKTSFKFFV